MRPTGAYRHSLPIVLPLASVTGFLALVCLLCATLDAQTSSSTARRIAFATNLPSTCNPNTGDIFFRTSDHTPWYCSATNTWSQMGIPSESGIVTINGDGTLSQLLSGTANQITVTTAAGATTLSIPANPTIPSNAKFLSYIIDTAIAAPATPAAGLSRIYVDSTSKLLSNKDDAGLVTTTVQPLAAVANNFITSIVAGLPVAARPTCANLSDSSASCATDATNASNIGSGTLAVARGGTNIGSYTKGDLLCASGATTLTKLGVGSNTQVLTANSAATCGVDWEAGGAGGGGSVFTGSTAVASSFSATPTFSLADVSVKSPTRFEPGALTANVTAVTFTNKTAGAKFSIAWLQDGTGGRTVAYGASATGGCQPTTTAGSTTTQQFEVAADGTTVVGVGCSSTDGSVIIPGSTSGASTVVAPSTGGGTVTLFAGSDTVVGRATTDTLTNKTLTNSILIAPALGTPASGVMTNVTGIPAPGAFISPQGNGTKVQLSTGTTTTDNCVKFDANGNTVDSGIGCNGGGGVTAKATNYTLLSTDSGKLVTFNGSSLTATLPSPVPSTTWTVGIKNLHTSALTISRNGLTINGGTSNITLQQYQDAVCFSDGTNYICGVPDVAGTAITLTPAVTGITIACPTCIVASSPGAGLAHFAGSTQTVTSSAVVSADLNITTTTCSSQFVSAISSGGVGTCSGLTAAEIPVTPLATPGTSITLSGPRGWAVCTSTCTVTLPVPSAGYEFCIVNDNNVSTAITLAALGSSAMYENSARTAYGTAGTGTLVVAAALKNKVCVLGRDSTHYLLMSADGGAITVN